MIKESINEEDTTLVDIYAQHIGTLKYIKQILTDIKGEMDRDKIIVGDFCVCVGYTVLKSRSSVWS